MGYREFQTVQIKWNRWYFSRPDACCTSTAIVLILGEIFKACLRLSYIPVLRKEVTVTYILKAGIILVLLHASTAIVPILEELFKACLSLSHISVLWKEVSVSYIPKAGKGLLKD